MHLGHWGISLILLAGCAPGATIEKGSAPLLECVRGTADYCAACASASTDSAAGLSEGCAAMAAPGEAPPVTERGGTLTVRLSGDVAARLFGSETVVDEIRESDVLPLTLRARATANGPRVGLVIDDPRATGGGPAPSLAPVEAHGGRYEGNLTLQVDYGDLGNTSLARNGNRRATSIGVSFRLMRGSESVSSLDAADRLEGEIGTFVARGVVLSKPRGPFGVVEKVDLRLHGPATLALEALPAPRPADAIGTPEWRDCMRATITRDCCVPPAVFADVVRIARLPDGLTPPASCSRPSEEDDAPGPVVAPGTSPVDLGRAPARRDARLAAGAHDWFTFATDAPGRWRVETFTAPRDDDSATDTRLELWAEDGLPPVVGHDDDSSDDGAASALEVDLAAGRYRLRVAGHAPATTGPYTLSIAPGGATPVDEEPARERGGNAPYAVVGTRLPCDSGSAGDVACWANVYRQVIAGTDLRGRTLRTISWDMDASARLLESLELEVYLIHGAGARPGRVLEQTRRRVGVLDGLLEGSCAESGETLACTLDFGRSVVLPSRDDDWFILEIVGRDDGEVAPDGSAACGRYPQRVAGDQTRDESVRLGGALQIHDWADEECGFSYSAVADRPDLDLGARVTVE